MSEKVKEPKDVLAFCKKHNVPYPATVSAFALAKVLFTAYNGEAMRLDLLVESEENN